MHLVKKAPQAVRKVGISAGSLSRPYDAHPPCSPVLTVSCTLSCPPPFLKSAGLISGPHTPLNDNDECQDVARVLHALKARISAALFTSH